VLAWFGFTLAQPGDTFGASFSFTIMRDIASENIWAAIFLGMAFLGLMGYNSRDKWALRASAFVLSTGHGVIALCFALGGIGHPLLPGSGAYGVFAGLGYYLTWRYFK
jgi:hypothetical protein